MLYPKRGPFKRRMASYFSTDIYGKKQTRGRYMPEHQIGRMTFGGVTAWALIPHLKNTASKKRRVSPN